MVSGKPHLKAGERHDQSAVDAVARTLQIDDGPVVDFEGNEEDLEIRTSTGKVVYVDVTEVVGDYQGELKIGIHGRIRQLFASDLIAQ